MKLKTGGEKYEEVKEYEEEGAQGEGKIRRSGKKGRGR